MVDVPCNITDDVIRMTIGSCGSIFEDSNNFSEIHSD